MAGGYKLPGTEIQEVGQSNTPRSSSSQRKPCFIGYASPYKTIKYEEITKSAVSDVLEFGSEGIYSVLAAGSQQGLKDLTLGTDFNLDYNSGTITWITDSEDIDIADNIIGGNLFANLDNFSAFDSAVTGTDATSGYQEVGLSVASTDASGLAGAVEYFFQVNATEYSITPTSTGLTIADVITLMDAQITSDDITVYLSGSDIRFTNDITGPLSTITLASGVSGTDLFATLTGFSTFDTAVDGIDATAGYQEVGLTTLSTNASGLTANTRYYFKVNSTQYNITTATALTFADIVALMDAAVTAGGFTVAFTSGDIRITNDTTGASSLITLQEVLPKSVTGGQLTVSLASAATIGHLAGKAVITTGSYEFLLADDLIIGDTSITLSGTQGDLEALAINDSLTISTLHKVSTNGTYFVSYKYNRPTTDYIYKEFSKFDDVVNDLGSDDSSNPLVMISNLALTYYNLPKIAIVQVAATNQNSDYVEALEKIEERDVQTVGVLNSSSTVRNAVIAHVNNRNLPSNKKERIYYTGSSLGYNLGDKDTPNSICGISYSIKNEAVVYVNTPRAKYTYKDETAGLDVQTAVDGAFVAAAIGAYRDSYSYPSQTIIGHTIPGLELYSEDFDDYYTDTALITAGNASCFLTQLGSSNALVVADDLTTDNTSIEKNNINIITAKHYIAKDIRAQLDRTYVGKLILNRDQYQVDVQIFLKKLMNTYKNLKIIESVIGVEVTLPADKRDTIYVKYQYSAVYTGKYFEGEYTIVV